MKALAVFWIWTLAGIASAPVAFAQRMFVPAACDLTKAFVESVENWEQPADDLVVDYNKSGFKFTDNKKRILGCAFPTVKVLGVPAMETRFFFAPDRTKIDRLEFTLYDKGDAARENVEMSREDFDRMLSSVATKLSDGEPPKVVSRKGLNGITCSRAWPKRVPAAELSWGLSGPKGAEQIEYATLKFFREKPAEARIGLRAKGKASAGSKAGSAANVKKTDEGDVYIANVPMVDQGQKGYCSVAAAERVLRYFGNDVSEHEIAQMAGTQAEGGTEISSMIAAVEAIGRKCGLGKTEVVSNMRGWADAENRLAKYNQAAKKMKRPALNLGDFVTQSGNMRTFHVGEMQAAMEPKVLKAMALKDGSGYKRFLSGVKAQVDKGIPLFWSVQLGIYPEPECPQAFGGHMRLIIGYNAETREILYTDSWGAGHELKRMPQEWAWTITGNMLYLKPRM